MWATSFGFLFVAINQFSLNAVLLILPGHPFYTHLVVQIHKVTRAARGAATADMFPPLK